jgi:hypothetical protein
MTKFFCVFLAIVSFFCFSFADIEYDRKDNIKYNGLLKSSVEDSKIEPIPIVSVVMRCGYRAEAESLFSYMEAFNSDSMPACIAIDPDSIGAEGRITYSDIKKYRRNGWEIIATCEDTSWFRADTVLAGGWNNPGGGSFRQVWSASDLEQLLIGKKIDLGVRNTKTWLYPLSVASPYYRDLVSRIYDNGICRGYESSEGYNYRSISRTITTVGGEPNVVPYGGNELFIPNLLPMNDISGNTPLVINKVIASCIDFNGWTAFVGTDWFGTKGIDDFSNYSSYSKWTDSLGYDSTNVMKGLLYWLNDLRSRGKIEVVTVGEASNRLFRRGFIDGAEWIRNPSWDNSDSLFAIQAQEDTFYLAYMADGIRANSFLGENNGYVPFFKSYPAPAFGVSPLISHGTGWGGTDEVSCFRAFFATKTFRFTKLLPGNCWANFSFYLRVDPGVEADATDESLSVRVVDYIVNFNGDRMNASSRVTGNDFVLAHGLNQISPIDSVSVLSNRDADFPGSFSGFAASDTIGGTYKRVSVWKYISPMSNCTVFQVNLLSANETNTNEFWVSNPTITIYHDR